MILIFKILLFLLTIYVGFSVLYILIFAFASKLRKNKTPDRTISPEFRCLVLIPAYKEDFVILEVAETALQQNYPSEKYDVVVIADSLKSNTLKKLRKLDLKVIEVSFEQSTKAKALNEALQFCTANYDIAYVIDADNIMEPDFISKINDAFNNGYKAVQGHRIAKNINTPVALLDAISEEINNSIFRQGHRALGLSSAFIGSGLAIEYDLFKSIMKKVTSVGEDKELEMVLLKKGLVIEYVPDAFVFDEKIQEYDNMVNQRRRWLYAQYNFFRRFFFDSFVYLFKGNFNYFDKVLQQSLLPRSILIGIVALYWAVLLILYLIGVQNINLLMQLLWLIITIFLTLALLLATPINYYNIKTLKALMYLPKGIFVMFKSMIKSWFSGNTFFHTKHGVN